MRTLIRSFDWRNELTLYSKDIAISTEAYDIENSLGYAYFKIGKLDLAKEHTQKSVDLYPHMLNLNNLGVIYLKEGDFQKAQDLFRQSISKGDYYLPYQNLSVLLAIKGNPKEAEQFVNEAIKKYPNNVALWIHLAVVEHKLDKIEEAKNVILKAYSIAKDNRLLAIYQRLEKNQPPNIDFGF